MNYYKLICETDFNDYEIIKETNSLTGQRQMKLRGPYIVAEMKNANGRSYPKELLQREVDKFRREMIDTHRAFGELEHPEESFINPDRACVLITKLDECGNTWIGESVVLGPDPEKGIPGTPCGTILQSILMHGGKVGFSTRGVGKLSDDKTRVIEYSLSTVDAVLNPSIGQMCEGILESKNYIVHDNGLIAEVAYDAFEKSLKKLPTPTEEKDQYLKAAVEKFCNSFKH